jgi:hypothetical protein
VLLRIPQGYLCHCLHLTLDRGCPGTCQQTSAPLGDPRSPRSLSQSSSTSFISVSLHTYTPPPISPAISHSPTTALLPTTLPLSPSRHTPPLHPRKSLSHPLSPTQLPTQLQLPQHQHLLPQLPLCLLLFPAPWKTALTPTIC